jgi:hypothetical protein
MPLLGVRPTIAAQRCKRDARRNERNPDSVIGLDALTEEDHRQGNAEHRRQVHGLAGPRRPD